MNLFQPFKTTISHFYFIAVMNKKKNKNSKLAKLYFTVKKIRECKWRYKFQNKMVLLLHLVASNRVDLYWFTRLAMGYPAT